MRSIASKIAALAALTVLAAPAGAATTTTTFQVTATVNGTCSVSASSLNFGTYNPLSGSPADVATTMSVQCTLSTPYTVGLSPGNGTGATVASRKMAGTSNGDTLGYTLYQDAAHATVWGETIGSDTVAGVGTGASDTLTVYGRIPAAQYVKPDSYADTITVTVGF